MPRLPAIFVASIFLLSIISGAYSQNQSNETQNPAVSPSVSPSESPPASPSASAEPSSDKAAGKKSEAMRKTREEKTLDFLKKKYPEKIKSVDEETLQKLAKLPPGIAKKYFEDANFGKILDKWEVKKVDRAELKKAFQKRDVANEKLRGAEDKLKAAKEKLEKSRGESAAKKEQFKKTKKPEDAKAYLESVIDLIIERANKIQASVEASNDITEEKSKEIIGELDSRIEKLAEWKTKVQAASTKAELKVLSKEIKDGWKHLEHVFNMHGWRVSLEHFGGILRQAEHLDIKLNNWIDFAEKNNAAITDKDSRISNFESKLAEAKKSHESAVADFKKLKGLVAEKSENITNSDLSERKALEDSIKSSLRVGKKSLKEARDLLVSLLKDIVKGLKDKKPLDDSGKPVEIKEEAALDPAKGAEGIDTEEGENTVTVAQEAAADI